MPVTIKTAKMQYKNSQGDYVGINSVSDRTTAEMVADINDAGTNQLAAVNGAGATQTAAVQAKGTEVLESIPDEYEELSENVVALHSRISDVKDDIDETNKYAYAITNEKIYQPEILNLRVLNGSIVKNDNFRSVVIPVTTGRHYKIEAIGEGNRNKVYGITNETWDIGTNAVDIGYTPEITSRTQNITIDINPSGYQYLFVMFAYSTATPFDFSFYVKVTETASSQFTVNGIEVPKYAQMAAEIEDAIGTNETEIKGTYETGHFWSVESTVAEKKTAVTYVAFSPIAVSFGGKYKATVYQGTSVKQDPVVIVDAQYNILTRYRGTNSQDNTFNIEITNSSARYALVTSYAHSADMSFKRIAMNDVSQIKADADRALELANAISKADITTGKYVSILGDSISALAGTLPSGNEAYYTGSNYGITSADDMWWKIVADKLGMNVLVNNSWSGSQVCDRTPGTKIPASYPSRCQALHNSSHNPDYVMIAMGVNDYSYNSYLGDWDGKTMPVDDTDFTQSYALMLNRIKSAYPNVKIICITPWFVQRGHDTGIAYCNGTQANPNYTESAYGEVIRKLCDMLGAIYIEGDVGFNRYNYYPTYCQDDETQPTHPNKVGQAVMGNVIAGKIRSAIY